MAARFEFFEFGNYKMARVFYPDGQVQEVRRMKDARLDQVGVLTTDVKDGHVYLFTMSHSQARQQQLTNEEWDYNATPGTIGGHVL